MATLKITTVDQNNNPVSGILLSASCEETGQIFQRSSDGSGYSDLALESLPPYAKNILLSVVKEGFAVYTEELPIPDKDTSKTIQLTPF